MTLVHFSPLDYVVVGAFLAAVLALGFSARLREASMLQFLTAGRALSLPAFVATLVTVWYGGILGVAESVSYFGIGAWLLVGVPYYVFAIVYAIWYAPRVREAEQISIPERVHRQFGRGAGLIAALLIFCLAVPAAHVLMLGSLVQSVTGWPLLLAVIVGAGVGTAFLYRGGLLADVRVSFIAFAMMYVGFIAIDAYCLITHPPASILPALREQDLLHFAGGKGPVVVLTFFILGAWTLIDPAFHQRVTSSASPQVGRRGVLTSVAFWFLFDVLSIGAALYAVALAHPRPEDAKLLYPAFGSQILPAGLRGLFFCGMLGTILSAMVGYTLVSGATVGREMIARAVPSVTDRQATQWSRFGIVIGLLVAIVLAVNIKSVVDLWYAWSGCVIGALLFPVTAAYFPRWRLSASPRWISASMALAFALSVGWLIQGQATNNPFLNVAIIRSEGGWRFSAEAEAQAATPGRWDLPVGTMIPALVISGLVLGAGTLVSRRRIGK